MENADCDKFIEKLRKIKVLKSDFDKKLNISRPFFDELNIIKINIEQELKDLSGLLMEKRFELKRFYEENVNVLSETGLIEILSNGREGFIDITGKERPIPKYEEFAEYVTEKYSERKEFFDRKREQGFTEIRIIPFGLPLKHFKLCAEELIKRKYQEGKLLGTDGTKIELNEEEPVFIAEEYKCAENEQGADVSGELVYYPKKYDKKNHGGKTKQEILNEQEKEDRFTGWEFQFVEDLPDLPGKGKGKVVNGRKQIEAGLSPEEYLKMQETDGQYEGERGQTAEAELTEFIYNLKAHDRVIDDWEGGGKGSWNISGYFKSSGLVCLSGWVRYIGRLFLYGRNADSRDDYRGCRFGVRI